MAFWINCLIDGIHYEFDDIIPIGWETYMLMRSGCEVVQIQMRERDDVYFQMLQGALERAKCNSPTKDWTIIANG